MTARPFVPACLLLLPLVALAGSACGGAARVEGATVAGPGSHAGAAAFPDLDNAWTRHHVKGLALRIPLPDLRSWRLDEREPGVLVGLHEGTRSSLRLEVTQEAELMNRQRCEEHARSQGLVPANLRTVDDEVTVGPEAYDTRIWTAVAPGKDEHAPITGYVFAFAAYVRKCLVMRFTSEVPSGRDESVLSSRLAAIRVRAWGGITLDDFDAIPRERPSLRERPRR